MCSLRRRSLIGRLEQQTRFLSPSLAHFPKHIHRCYLDIFMGLNFEKGRLSSRVFPSSISVPFIGLDFFRFLRLRFVL